VSATKKEQRRDAGLKPGATKDKGESLKSKDLSYINLLRGDGVGLFAVDAEVGDSLLYDFFFDFSVEE
jgi:hypothetical protein